VTSPLEVFHPRNSNLLPSYAIAGIIFRIRYTVNIHHYLNSYWIKPSLKKSNFRRILTIRILDLRDQLFYGMVNGMEEMCSIQNPDPAYRSGLPLIWASVPS